MPVAVPVSEAVTGADLRAWRLGRQWTAREAAGWAGVPGTVRSQIRTWQRWEAGSVRLPPLLAARIEAERVGSKGSRARGTRSR